MVYAIIIHPSLKKSIKNMDSSVKERFSRLLDKLEQEPANIGKPLKYSGGLLKEVYLGNYRVYYSISEDAVSIVAVLGIAHKDEQRKMIGKIS